MGSEMCIRDSDYNNDRISLRVFKEIDFQIDDQMEQIERTLGMYD